jgi:hypothetical protein
LLELSLSDCDFFRLDVLDLCDTVADALLLDSDLEDDLLGLSASLRRLLEPVALAGDCKLFQNRKNI